MVIETQAPANSTTGTPPIDLSWLDAARERAGVSAHAGKRGLTLDDITLEGYSASSESMPDDTGRQRGAASRSGVPRSGYHIREMSNVWSQNTSLLYEEAVQRQWSSATDIPWAQLEPLPDDIERAMCQLCTFLTE